jgi:hypothetical protein
MNSERFLITPDNALPHVVLWQSYSVEDVARIASACAGETHQDRIVEALKLLEAVEKIANPMAPWLEQDVASDDERVMDELRRQTPEIIKGATSETGRIDRMELCRIACEKAGRVGKGGKPLTDDRIEKLFHEWLSVAADSHARWEVFRTIPSIKIERCKKVIQAHNDSIAAQKNCDCLAVSWQALREKKKAAISNGLTEKKVAEIEAQCEKAEALFHASKDAAWEAERRITRSLNEAYIREVDRKRKDLTEKQKKAEREAFRLRFESGTGNAKRWVHDETVATALLLGQDEFTGLLNFLRFPPPSGEAAPRPPRPKDEFGQFITRPKDASGKFKAWVDDENASEEFPLTGLPQKPVERTEANRLRKKK